MIKDQTNKILIVDDHQETLQMYAEIFREKDFLVLEAKDGVEALDIATTETGLEAIFTGIIMPRMDGFQLVENLKKNTSTAKIPIIVNSHLGREEDRKKMETLGVNDFIVRGTTTPADAFNRIYRIIHKGNENYNLKIDFLSEDGEAFIERHHLPPEMKCSNCGKDILLRASYDSEKKIVGKLVCPECHKQY